MSVCRDDATTSKFIIGGTVGEALLPIVIGHTMSIFGAQALLYDTVIIAIAMLALYGATHFFMLASSTKKIDLGGGSGALGNYYSLPTIDDKEGEYTVAIV
jgi:hypothetical protein